MKSRICYFDKFIDMWSFGISLNQMTVAYFNTSLKIIDIVQDRSYLEFKIRSSLIFQNEEFDCWVLGNRIRQKIHSEKCFKS